jgi:O-antigen/teichoic acid export membrane protein
MAGGGLALSVLAFGAGQLAVLAFYEVPLVRGILDRGRESLWPVWNRASLARLAATTLPLGFVSMLVSLIIQTPRYFVEAYEGTEALGYWSAVVQLATVASVLLQPLGQASLTRLASYDRAHPGAYSKLLGLLIAAAVLTGMAGIGGAYLFGGWALRLIYRPEYEMLQPVLLVLMAGMVATNVCTVLGIALTAARRFRSQLALFAVTAAAGALSCAVLLPQYGLLGAAYAHAATWLVACAGGAAILFRHRRSAGLSDRLAEEELPYVAEDNPLA